MIIEDSNTGIDNIDTKKLPTSSKVKAYISYKGLLNLHVGIYL